MNKRITGIALLVLLLFASGAWAATLKPAITIKTSTLPSTEVGNAKYGEDSSAAIQLGFTRISSDAVVTIETEATDETGLYDEGTPDGTLKGVFKAVFDPKASGEGEGETEDSGHTVENTDTIYIVGKVWGVGSIPVKVKVTATWTPPEATNENPGTPDDGNALPTKKRADGDIVITAEKTLTFTSTAYAPESITLAEADTPVNEPGLPARKKDGETTFQSLVQSDGFVGLNTANAVKDDANVFKTTATLPVTWSAVGLPAGLKYEISKIEIDGAEDELTADDNTEKTTLENEGKKATITFKLTGTPTKAGAASVGITVANAGGSLTSDKHDLLVFAPAVFTTSEKLSEFTWGKEKTIKLAATGGLTNYPITFDYGDAGEDGAMGDTETTLKALGLTFDKETGEITGTIDKNDDAYADALTALTETADALPAKKKEVAADDLKFGSDKTKTFTLSFKAISPGVATSSEEDGDGDGNGTALPAKKKDTAYDTDGLTVTKDFTLTVKAAAPSIVNKDSLQDEFETALENLSISKETGAIVDAGEEAFALRIMAEGPGDFEWTVKNLPAGLTYEEKDDSQADLVSEARPAVKRGESDTTSEETDEKVYGKYIIIKVAGAEEVQDARPADKRGEGDEEVNPANIVQVVKNWPITVSVKTPGGTDSIKLTANIGTGKDQEFGITQEKAALPAGVHNITQDISGADLGKEEAEALEAVDVTYKKDTVKGIALTAFPGPVTWKADNLPDGFALSVDKEYPYGTRAYLVGNYKTASKKANQVYKITATNTTLKTSSVVSNEVTVYGPPEITTKSLPDLTIGKKYSSKIAVKGLDISVDVTIEVSKDATTALPAKKKAEASTGDEWGDKTLTAENYSLKFDATNFTLTGSLDKYLDEDRTKILKVTIKAKNPGYNVEAEEADPDAQGQQDPDAQDSQEDAGGAGTVTTKVIALKIKPVAPAFKTTKLSDYYGFGDNVDADGSGKGHSITITGSKPMDLLVYVAGKDAKSIGLNTTGDNVVFPITGGDGAETGVDGALPAQKKGEDDDDDSTSTVPTFTVTKEDTDSETITLKIGYEADQGWAFASLPITVSADNGSGTSKGVSKVFKVAVKGSSPSIVSMDEGNYLVLENKKSRDITVNVTAGGAIPNYNNSQANVALPAKKKADLNSTAEGGILIFVSGDEPLTLTASQKFGVAKNGVTVDSIDLSVEDDFDASTTPRRAFWIHGKAGTLATKETKTAITLTATNAQTKAKADCKVTIVGQLAPEITTKATAAKKEIEVGKSLSLRLAAKGTKPIMWKLVGDDETTEQSSETQGNGTLPATKRDGLTVAEYEALLVNYGLSFDQKNGMFKGKAVYPTSDDATQKLYEPKVFKVVAYNDAGDSTPIAVTIGIKGRKPKLSSTLKAINLTISRDKDSMIEEDATTGGTTGSRILKSDISYTDTKSYVSWDIVGTVASPLTGLKVGNSDEESGRSIGYLDLTDVANLTSSKATTVKLKASNYGSEATGSVKVTVNDPKPAFDTSSSTFFAQIEAQEKKDVTNKSVTLAVDDFSKSSNNTTLDWKILRKPTGKVTAAIKPASNQKSAAITITVKKGLASKDVHNSAKIEVDGEEVEDKIFHTSFTVQVMNKTTKELAVATVSVDVRPYDTDQAFPTYDTEETPDTPGPVPALPAQKDALPEDEELTVGEGTVTYGDARNESALTQAERRMLAEGGYIIAAILPEITTDESGQYDLEAVSLDEAALEGYELVWFAFPRNSEYSEDDTIAEFYDEAGAEVFAVPEGRIVVPAPWLEKDVTYAPVIAVKAPVAGEAKDSLDEAEAGDTVTEKAIEEAAESTAEGSEEAVTVSEESKHAE